MRKLFITGVLLCSAIILIGAQTGFAWPTYEGGCDTCHGSGFPALSNHTIHQGQACDICHANASGGDTPIPTSKCIACHPRTEPGKCNLVNFHDPSQGASCLTCHSTECAPVTTTTTAGSTTTTTVPVTDCITIEPTSVTVSGEDETLDVGVTFTRTDIFPVTEEQLEQLVIEVDTGCAPYITINSSTFNIGESELTGTLNITVQGNAPASECSIQVSDPNSAFTPPLNCTASFTIFSSPTTTTTTPTTSTTIIPSECMVMDVVPSPAFLKLKAGLLPKVRRIAITGMDSHWNQTSAVSIEDIPIVIPLRAQNPEGLFALIVIPSTLTGFQPGTKAIGVATGAEVCTGTVDIQ
jgi:hypothetical protein